MPPPDVQLPLPSPPLRRAPWDSAAAGSPAASPAAVHDPAARAQRALRPLRSDGAALAAAAELAATLTEGSIATRSMPAIADALPAATKGPLVTADVQAANPKVPTASPARPRGYRPPFAGDTLQYRGRVRSMPPKQQQQQQQQQEAADAVFGRHSAPMLRSAAASEPPQAGPAASAAPLQSPGDASQAGPLSADAALPPEVTTGTPPAPPPSYRGRQRSVAPGRGFRSGSDPAALPAAAAERALSLLGPPAPAAGAADVLEQLDATQPAQLASPGVPDPARAPDAAASGGREASGAASDAPVGTDHPVAEVPHQEAGLSPLSAAVRRSVSSSVTGGRSLLGRGQASVPLSPPPTHVRANMLLA